MSLRPNARFCGFKVSVSQPNGRRLIVYGQVGAVFDSSVARIGWQACNKEANEPRWPDQSPLEQTGAKQRIEC